MAVVLVLLSLMTAAGLSFLSGKLETARIKDTEERMEYILDAVERFEDENGYLPCPADAELAYSDTNFGDGTGTGAGTSSGGPNCSAANESYDTTSSSSSGPTGVGYGNVVAGAVPINQLALPPQYLVDGWNRKFLYVVDEELTESDDYSNANSLGRVLVLDECYDNATAAKSQWTRSAVIRRNTSTGAIYDPATASAPYDAPYGAAVLLLSFGKNGHGAWKIKGGATRLDSYDGTNVVYELEETNAHKDVAPFDDVFVVAPLNTNADPGNPTSGYVPSCRTNTYYYDDIVAYRTKWQLP
ncbi:MAG: hypothetical protein H6908_00615 [Hyphomicrobiales bacterium]|nr:hypothetical protein [Hyphomicrobiales bacterium]